MEGAEAAVGIQREGEMKEKVVGGRGGGGWPQERILGWNKENRASGGSVMLWPATKCCDTGLKKRYDERGDWGGEKG